MTMTVDPASSAPGSKWLSAPAPVSVTDSLSNVQTNVVTTFAQLCSSAPCRPPIAPLLLLEPARERTIRANADNAEMDESTVASGLYGGAHRAGRRQRGPVRSGQLGRARPGS